MRARGDFALSLAGGCHLGFLALVALYTVAYYPGAALPVLALLGTAVVSETCPIAWKRWLFGEMLLVVASLATYVAFVEVRAESFQGWIRMVLAYWMLVPSRVGMLRWLLSLVIGELLILGAGHARFLDLPGLSLPLMGRALIASPLLLLVPIGLGSVAVDGWLSGVAAARVRGPRPPAAAALMRWSVLPVIALAALLLSVGPSVVRHAKRVPVKLPAMSGVREPQIQPGEAQWVVKDPTPRARLLWEDPTQPQIEGTAYLRAFTLPTIALTDSFVSWKGGRLDGLRQAPGAFDPNARFAWAVRLPMGSDAVLHADGARGVDLDELLADRHGNLYITGFDEIQRAYRVNLDPPESPEEEDPDPATSTALPPQLDQLPWALIEDPAWRGLDARTAAAAISARLGERCSYDLKDLPSPAAGPGGIMRTFLFGAETDRRGHCQYFATAAAILLRRQGYAARCVSGYASDERDQDGYTFRGLHAHAWVEVRDAGGRWLRVDATPAGHLAVMAEHGLEPAYSTQPTDETAMVLPGKPVAPSPPIARTSRHRGAAWLALGAIAVIASWAMLGRQRRVRIDPAQAELMRQNENLVRLAQQLGVPVAPHTTLSELATRLSERTGIDLTPLLDAHLAARFGGGPLPPPWPLERLRSAGVERASARLPATR